MESKEPESATASSSSADLSVGSASATTLPATLLHVQKLAQVLDLGPFVSQLQTLLASPIKVPASSIPRPGVQSDGGKALFSVRHIWDNDAERKKEVSALYNFKNLRKRQWLRDILLEESDSDSDMDTSISERDLKTLLKIHRCRRKYQKQYHSDILNSQYTYYSAGLISEEDRFPAHQNYVMAQYGRNNSPPAVSEDSFRRNVPAALVNPLPLPANFSMPITTVPPLDSTKLTQTSAPITPYSAPTTPFTTPSPHPTISLASLPPPPPPITQQNVTTAPNMMTLKQL